MEDDSLRRILSSNIKAQRKKLGFSQEKLAERAGISAGMVRDIECYRTWVSDKTLLRLSVALRTDTYQLFKHDDDENGTIVNDLIEILLKWKEDIDFDVETVLKKMNLKKIESKKPDTSSD